MRGAYRRLLPKRLSSGGAREGLASLLLEEKAAHGPTVPAGRRHKKYRPPKRVIGIFGGGRWISPDGDKLRLHLPRKEKYRPSKRTIGIFGGGRWISPDGDKLRLHLPCKEKYRPSKRTIGIFVFGDRNYWHPVTMRFPVCFKKFF